jgi:hypothetical protein
VESDSRFGELEAQVHKLIKRQCLCTAGGINTQSLHGGIVDDTPKIVPQCFSSLRKR